MLGPLALRFSHNVNTRRKGEPAFSCTYKTLSFCFGWPPTLLRDHVYTDFPGKMAYWPLRICTKDIHVHRVLRITLARSDYCPFQMIWHWSPEWLE